MKKFAKISLVAAVAVAGLSSTVSAQPLEEAIKGVDVSGMVRYRFENVDAIGTTSDDSDNNYRLDVKTSAKVNDIVKANVTVGITGNNGNPAVIDTEDADAAPGLSVRDANFAFALPMATVIVGKQSVPGPFVDNAGDDVTRGNGVVALAPVAGWTLAAGYMNNSTVGGFDLVEVGVIGEIAGVKADVFVANVMNVLGRDLTAVSYHANTKIAAVTIDARYSTKDNDLSNVDEATLAKIAASTKISNVDVALAYATTGKNNAAGATANSVSIDGDNDAAVDFKVFQASLGALADADAYVLTVGTELMPSVYGKLVFLDGSYGTADTDVKETMGNVAYSMSKNFALSATYSNYENGTTVDTNKLRVEAKFTF